MGKWTFRLLMGMSFLLIAGMVFWELKEVHLPGKDSNENAKQTSATDKADNPLQFAQLYNELRTRPSESRPKYPMGYQVRELNKARQSFSAARLSSNYNFEERGPGNVPGRTRALVVDPEDINHQTFIAGSVGGGIWKTTDGGISWTNKTTDLPNLAISWMTMSESNPDIIYAGTGESIGAYIGIRGTGIYKSTDKGETWNLLASTSQNEDFQMVNRIIVDSNNPDILLAATSNDALNGTGYRSGIFKSIDGGASWSQKFDAPAWIQQLVATPGDFNTLYATAYSTGVYKSTDAGETWFFSSLGLNPDGRTEMAVSPVNTNRLFASAEGSYSGSGSDLYISDDAAATWYLTTEENEGLDEDFLGGQGGYDNTILAHPFNEDIVYVGGVSLWKFDIRDQSITVDKQFLGIEEQGTTFMTLVNFGATYYGGRVEVGDQVAEDFVSVEIRFGPDGAGGYLKQNAHRFTVPDGRGSGVSNADYSYQDYVEVPFQVWDVENNRQLMVSFRDQQKDGVFNLLPEQTDNDFWQENSREYIFINNVDYNESAPDPNIAVNGQHEYRLYYFIWPFLTEGETWDNANLPESKFVFVYESLDKRLKASTSIADAYGNYDGLNRFFQSIGATVPEGVHPDHHNIIPIIWDNSNQSFQLLIANDGGVYRSDIGMNPGGTDGSWNIASLTYNTSQFYAVDKAPGESRYVGGLQDNGTWMSAPGEEGSAFAFYRRSGSGDGFGCAWNHADPNKLLISVYNNNIKRSVNGGSSFADVTGIGDTGINGPFVTELENYHADPDVVYTSGSSGVWKSSDFGNTWQRSPIDTLWRFASTMNVRISHANPHIVWAGSAMQESPSKYSLHVSTDEGVSFNYTNNYTDREMGRISGMATHPILDSTAFALFSFAEGPKILRTNNLGQSWHDISGFGSGTTSSNGFPDVALYDLLVMPHDTSTIWAGTDIGIVESTDAGQSWHLLVSNMPAVSIWDMKVVDKEVVIGTHGRGIWSVNIDELPGHVYIPEIISSYPSLFGELILNVETKSDFDSTHLYINGQLFAKYNEASLVGRLNLATTYAEARTGTAYVRSFYKGKPYVSHVYNFELFDYEAAVESYENTFQFATNDFMGYGFSERNYTNFKTRALHSEHNYVTNASYDYILKIPIKVKTTNALINFDEIVLVEPGMNDYVRVQGSLDGKTWVDLVDAYDASANSDWQTAYESFQIATDSYFKFRSIDLLETFQPDDEILIRFALSADSETNGWGWAIDNLRIQTPGVLTGIEDVIKSNSFSIYPNPVLNDSFTIEGDSQFGTRVYVYNMDGQLMLNKVLDHSDKGNIEIPWYVADGLYIVSIESGLQMETQKILIDRN